MSRPTRLSMSSPNVTPHDMPPMSPLQRSSTTTGGTRRMSTRGEGTPHFPGTISNAHIHHYHYHLYQTTVTETAKEEDEHDEEERQDAEADADMEELMELFPDGIPDELLMDDGSGVPQEVVDEMGNVITVIKPRKKAMKNIFGVHDISPKEADNLTFFAKVYRFLHDPTSSFIARLWSVMMIIAIITSSVMILLQSMPNLSFVDSISTIVTYVEFYSVILFTADYVLKLFSVHSYADCILPKPLPYNVLFRFCIQPLNMLDFISIVPFWVQTVLGDGATSGNTISLVFRILRLFRAVRLLKIAAYSRTIDIFFRVLLQAWDAWLLLGFFVGFGCIAFGTVIYLCEQGTLQTTDNTTDTYGKYIRTNVDGDGTEVSPFSSILVSFWWVITTLTTVGYGDMVPTSPMGRITGGVTMLSGVLFISTPLVIFGAYFSIEYTKEIDRVAFVQRRAEKVKRKTQEKEAQERRERERAENPYAVDIEEMSKVSPELMSPSLLPGQVPPSPSGVDHDTLGLGMSGFGTSPAQRPFARQSLLARGSTFLGRQQSISGMAGLERQATRGSIFTNGHGGGDVNIRNMAVLGPNGCTCPCMCGARNLAGTMIPGENVIGGVRRSTFARAGPGSKLTMSGAPMLTNPTAADQLAMKKGMELAGQVLPDRGSAERGAQQMASSAGSTQLGNMSVANVLEMQQQLESLKMAVSQLGGLLVAGGAPAPAIAKAMMDSIVPDKKRGRSSSKSISMSPAETNSTFGGGGTIATGTPPPSDTNGTTGGGSPDLGPRSSLLQPSNGKLVKTPTSGPMPSPSPAGDAAARARRPSMAITGTPAAARGSISIKPSPKAAALTPPTAKNEEPSSAAAVDFALPPAASVQSSIPSTTEMVPMSSPVDVTPLASPSAASDNQLIETPAASPSVAAAAAPFEFAAPDEAEADVVAAIVPVSVGDADVPTPSPSPPIPDPSVALTVDQIVPARPVREFPPPPADESVTDCTIRMLSSLISTPKLSQKLLEKPPFRFLHDIVASMIRAVGFPESYFDDSEMTPTNLTEIAPKLEFLEKLLDLISIVNQVDLAHINPKKIVAGLEYEQTNQMLQEFAKAAASGITVQQITQMMEAQEAFEAAGGVLPGAEGLVEEGIAEEEDQFPVDGTPIDGSVDSQPDGNASAEGVVVPLNDAPPSDETPASAVL